jgi:hypothetical protein
LTASAPAKEIAQIGSVIGREFSHALLAAVAGKPEVQLASALDRLVATVGSGVRVVHRRVRYARSEGGEGAA